MKRAALYARVSGDVQAKEGTIESQVLALKKQIAVRAISWSENTSIMDFPGHASIAPRWITCAKT